MLVAVEFVATNGNQMLVAVQAAIKRQLSRWVAPVSNTQLWLANVASHEIPQVVSAAVVQVGQV